MNNYILDENGDPQRCSDILQWAEWFEKSGDARHVAKDTIGDSRISTVFLGIDHSFGGGPPLLYETMILGGTHDGFQERYGSDTEAIEGHAQAVEMVRQA